MTSTENEIRQGFFTFLFGEDEGYICICTQLPGKKETFAQKFFAWPGQTKKMLEFIEHNAGSKNVWFGVNLLSAPERTKAYCRNANLVWADLDTCDPAGVEPKPQCVIQSSPERWQAIWRLDTTVDPFLAEQYSKKIAYKYVVEGADPSGWDLTQLLRVPLTRNFKYGNAPKILLNTANPILCPVEVFEALDVDIPTSDDPLEADTPDADTLPDPIAVVYKYSALLRATAFFELYDSDPPDDADWSKLLWRLINICIEVGMSREEAFTVAAAAKCNKYARDNRPLRFLWREIVKADTQQRRLEVINKSEYKPLLMPILVSEEELGNLKPTFVDLYRNYGKDATDAVVEFHNLSAFMLLSFFLSGNVRLPTSYGEMVPNLWGLILGDSTLTRKTTAMNLAMDFVNDLDRELILASDGSAEGILTGLAARPSRVSIFYKDEVTGFFESIQKKDYLSGMAETMTQLYDVPKYYPRRLRKETIELVSPVFIFFGGGIKERMHHLVKEEFILSGFMPRFIIVSGEADLSMIRKTGPPTVAIVESRNAIREHLANLYETYTRQATVIIGGQTTTMETKVEAKLTESAWERYGAMEHQMVEAAHGSPLAMLALPSFERLSRSLLKMSVLLAASRQLPDTEGKITVDLIDVLGAGRYIQEWGYFTVDLITNHGRNAMQRTVDKVLRSIRNNPGITRSTVGKNNQLTKRELDDIIGTLLDRGEITLQQEGRGFKLWAA